MAAAVEEIIHGASLRECAAKHGIGHATLRRWLLAAVPERYREIQREGLLARIVEADEALEIATSHLEVSRARERCRFARFDAERLMPDRWAPRHEVSGPGGGPITVQRMDPLERARRSMFVRALAQESLEPQEAEIVAERFLLASPATGSSSEHERYEATKRIEAERKARGL